MKTKQEQIKEIMETLLAHQPIIDVPYDKINDIAVALVKDGYGKISEYTAEIERLKAENYELTKKLEARLTCDFVKTAQKQAQIDVLKKIKNCREATDSDCYPYLEHIVNKVIKEVQNGEDKG